MNKIKQKNQELLAELAKHPEGSPEYRDIVSQIVANNVDLVKYQAGKYSRSPEYPTINDDDLISAGYLGLLKAIKDFTPEKRTGDFTLYAREWIIYEISKHSNQEQRRELPSLEDKFTKKFVISPRSPEEDFIAKEERQQQRAWLKKHINYLAPRQKLVLTAKYLSGEKVLRDSALARDFGRNSTSIMIAKDSGIENLQKMYHAEFDLTTEERAAKMETKAKLKHLILHELPPKRCETMLCKFYSLTKKSNAEVAQEVALTKRSVDQYLTDAYEKLCALCDDVKDTAHLKSILEFGL